MIKPTTIFLLSLLGSAHAVHVADKQSSTACFVKFDRTVNFESLNLIASQQKEKSVSSFANVQHEPFALEFNHGDLGGAVYGHFSVADLQELAKHPQFAGIEEEQTYSVSIPTGKDSIETLETESDAPWGLSRISQRVNLLNSSDTNPKGDYLYSSYAGANVTAYVIDTGVYIDHPEFEGRAVWGATIPRRDKDIDGNGHGTHVAGTIGSKTFGVAKKATLVAVKVLRSNGSGTTSDVVKGIQWAMNDFTQKRKGDPKYRATANMSLGGPRSEILDAAVNAAVQAGLPFTVAAGNEGADACTSSPASAANALTVAASTSKDSRAFFSNFGRCVDIFAPGLNIESTWNANNKTLIISGTSMASPHACGLMTLLLSLPSLADLTPEKLKIKILEMGTKDIILDTRKSPNVLLFSNPPKTNELAKQNVMRTDF